ncbi:hypothetical protein Efla_002708 [Eimeria flavescens]
MQVAGLLVACARRVWPFGTSQLDPPDKTSSGKSELLLLPLLLLLTLMLQMLFLLFAAAGAAGDVVAAVDAADAADKAIDAVAAVAAAFNAANKTDATDAVSAVVSAADIGTFDAAAAAIDAADAPCLFGGADVEEWLLVEFEDDFLETSFDPSHPAVIEWTIGPASSSGDGVTEQYSSPPSPSQPKELSSAGPP